MSKKRSKSGTGSASGQKWEQALVTAQFSEEVSDRFHTVHD